MTVSRETHISRVHELPCIACLIFEAQMNGGRVEAHHLVDKGYRKHSGGDDATIPLCAWHHRGEPPRLDMRQSQCIAIFGPSLALSKRAFVVRFGSERELLARTKAMLESRRTVWDAVSTHTG